MPDSKINYVVYHKSDVTMSALQFGTKWLNHYIYLNHGIRASCPSHPSDL